MIPVLAESIHQNDHATLYQWSQPQTPPANVVPLLVHGLGGCLAWMEPFIEALLAYYPAVLGLDSALYGPNPNQTGHIADRRHLLQTVHDGIETAYSQYNKPVLLIGLSLGGLIVSHALAKAAYRQPVAGVVLISPAFKASSKSFKLKTYAQVLSRSLILRSQQPISIPYDITSITGDPEQQTRLKNATGCIRALTPGSFLELLKLTLSRRGFNKLDYPLLMMRAQDDAICDVAAMDAEWQRWPHPQKQLTVFANAKHDLILEPVYPQMAHLVHTWQQHLA